MENKKYSKDWSQDENGVISHDEDKFYKVIKGQYGNPITLQQDGGSVYLTLVGDKILCEVERVTENGIDFTGHLRVIRASLSNPNQPTNGDNAAFLGEGYANSQRVLGPATKFWFIRLDKNPDESKYQLLSMSDFNATSKDNFGKTALFMAMMYGYINLLAL